VAVPGTPLILLAKNAQALKSSLTRKNGVCRLIDITTEKACSTPFEGRKKENGPPRSIIFTFRIEGKAVLSCRGG